MRITTLEGPLGLRIERGSQLDGRTRLEELPALVLPLASSIVELAVDGSSTTRLDRASFALVPRRLRYRLRAVSPVTEVLTLLVGEAATRAACREYRPHVDALLLADVLARASTFTRTRWVDEIAQRYLFERHVCEKHTSAAARFLETEIAKEVFFLGKEKLAARTRASVIHEDGDLVKRARASIEEHLFEPLRVGELARRMHTSESTLLRAFHRELGVTPAAYQRERRLDEAALLLGAGRFGVGEVAARVGYGNLAAFTVAFRRRFGVPPSEARSTPGAAVLPPHGEPPKRPRRKRKSE